MLQSDGSKLHDFIIIQSLRKQLEACLSKIQIRFGKGKKRGRED